MSGTPDTSTVQDRDSFRAAVWLQMQGTPCNKPLACSAVANCHLPIPNEVAHMLRVPLGTPYASAATTFAALT